mmetsp:Transcript_29626/g.90908  ORF Transcript_29626/g.90908 Transcript_29626/m.90908 type:complete len:218 (+) Transcript_29626:247-900(+)
MRKAAGKLSPRRDSSHALQQETVPSGSNATTAGERKSRAPCSKAPRSSYIHRVSAKPEQKSSSLHTRSRSEGCVALVPPLLLLLSPVLALSNARAASTARAACGRETPCALRSAHNQWVPSSGRLSQLSANPKGGSSARTFVWASESGGLMYSVITEAAAADPAAAAGTHDRSIRRTRVAWTSAGIVACSNFSNCAARAHVAAALMASTPTRSSCKL